MKKKLSNRKIGRLAFPLSLLSLAVSSYCLAQDMEEQNEEPREELSQQEQEPASQTPKIEIKSPFEEVLVLGRVQSAQHDIMLERMENESVVDLISFEQIGRIGDSTAASALKRVPGLTLVDDKFVYVRGLGERYSSSQLNGASVPSPDLTRNVLPLDIFPASIIESIAVQKGFIAGMPANFGGGNIDIRTKGMPDGFVASLEIGGGIHSNTDETLTYRGGDDDSMGEDDGTRALSPNIEYALHTYFTSLEAPEYDLSPEAIQFYQEIRNGAVTDAQAAAINADLAAELYSDLNIYTAEPSLHSRDFSVNLGHAFSVGENFTLGFLMTGDYDRSTKSDESITRTYTDPEQEFSEKTRTVENVSITATGNFGVRWGDEHEISSKNIFLRNTDDEVSIKNIYNTTASFGSGQGSRNYGYLYEQRELTINQITGSHRLGYETKEKFGFVDSFLDEMELNWFFSDSTSETNIPSETNIAATITRDVTTNEITSSRLTQRSRMFNTRFTELEDTMESSGWELKVPFDMGAMEVELSGGGKFDRRARTYKQLDLSVGSSSSAADATLSGPISSVLSEDNLTNPDYEYRLTYQSGLSRSYIAANTTDGFFGQVDMYWDSTLRVVLGARFEEFKQVTCPWQPFRRIGSPLLGDWSGSNESELPDCTYYEDDVYPSLAVTWNTHFWAEEFNLRFAASETVVRPDLREVSDSSYADPIFEDLIVQGNPDAVSSKMLNLDVRGEWYFSTGDTLSVSLFHKDITDPLEYFQFIGAEDTVNARILNAPTGYSSGVEFEFNKNMSFLGAWGDQFYVLGNVTLAESEIDAEELQVQVYSRQRPLTGASEYVVNLQFGFDSDDGKHGATLAYNVFGERVFTGGIGDIPDSYEQPFNALDLSYSYYMTDKFTMKFKMRNLLDEDVVIKQGDVDFYEKTVGQSFSFNMKYEF